MNQISNITYKEALDRASYFLTKYDKDAEIAKFYLWDMNQWTLTDWMTYAQKLMPEEQQKVYCQGIKRIALDHYPWQYLVHSAWFYGRQFYVDEATLIPRQETEDLVQLANHLIRKHELNKVLDIGTGSGIIAITLALENSHIKIHASDISQEALSIAQKNAANYDTNIEWWHSDVWAQIPTQKFDLIVTNPPYISQTERHLMGEDVKRYEPQTALFADHNGLAFYEKVSANLTDYLSADGWFLAEIGFQQGEDVKRIFTEAMPNSDISIRKDYTGNDRILVVHNKEEEND